MQQLKINRWILMLFCIVVILVGSISQSLGVEYDTQHYERGQKVITFTEEETIRYSSIYSSMVEKAIKTFAEEPEFEPFIEVWKDEEEKEFKREDSNSAQSENVSLESADGRLMPFSKKNLVFLPKNSRIFTFKL